MNISPHHGAAAPRCRGRRGWRGLAAAGAASIVCIVVAIAPACWGERARAAEAPSDSEILALVHQHCVQCHAAEPTHEAFAKPPAGIMLETIEEVRRYAPRILMQVVETRAMPLGNQTGMTDEDRERIAAWIEGCKE
jgi:uncharacterized membrane protein